MRRLALGGVFGPILFTIVVVTSALMRVDYSHIANFISELGATGSSNAFLMNYVGFAPAGLLFVLFGIALVRTLPWSGTTLIASILTILFGVGVAASGIFSCDSGCPQSGGSTENSIHNTIAPIAFLCLILASGILGFYFRKLNGWNTLSIYSMITSVVALSFFIALVGSLEERSLTGLWQRLLLATLFLWCAIVGLRAHNVTRIVSR